MRLITSQLYGMVNSNPIPNSSTPIRLRSASIEYIVNNSNSNPVVRVRLSLSASIAPISLSIIKYVKKLVLSVRYVNTTTYPINPIIRGADISSPDAICSSDSILTLDIPANKIRKITANTPNANAIRTLPITLAATL